VLKRKLAAQLGEVGLDDDSSSVLAAKSSVQKVAKDEVDRQNVDSDLKIELKRRSWRQTLRTLLC